MFDNPNYCEQCGHKELTVKHTYVLKRTYESRIPCCCKKRKGGIAAQHFYTLPEIWHELGYLDEGRSKIFERASVERLSVEEGKRLFFCQNCLDDAATEHDWETEQVGEAEIVEGPDAWMMYCHRCKTEAQFGWTETDRRGFLVPVSNLNNGPHHIWVDPGIEHRQTARVTSITPSTRNSRSATKRRRR